MTATTASVKKRKKQPKQFKNFAPIAFQSKVIKWSEKETQIIDWVKRRYSFNSSFDLHEHLSRFDSEVETLKALDRQEPVVTESLEALKALKKKLPKIEKIAIKMKKIFTPDNLQEISDTLELLFCAGHHIREKI